MKIILTSRVTNLGQIGEVAQVKNGYAKNFLIPSKKAIAFTPNNQKIFEAKRAEFEKENQVQFEAASKIKSKIENKDVVIIESASDDGRLYGSVSSLVIVSKINEMIGSKFLSRTAIFLKKPIKEIGVFEIKVELHSDAILDMRLIVTRSESEIEALLKADAKARKGEEKEETKVEASANSENGDETPANEEKPAKKTRKKKESTESAE